MPMPDKDNDDLIAAIEKTVKARPQPSGDDPANMDNVRLVFDQKHLDFLDQAIEQARTTDNFAQFKDKGFVDSYVAAHACSSANDTRISVLFKDRIDAFINTLRVRAKVARSIQNGLMV